MARGRPRKSGKRNASGRLISVDPYDRGSDHTRDKFSVYGTDGTDAIGRAYVMGLLGVDGLNLRNLARKIHRAYWPMLAVGREKSCLGLDVHGQAVNDNMLDPEAIDRKIAREHRLTDTLRRIDRMSRRHRKAFDDLCIEINPDNGPRWLDAMILARQHSKPFELAHSQALAMAIEALELVAGDW